MEKMMKDLETLRNYFYNNIELVRENDVRYFFGLNLNRKLGTVLTRKEIKEVFDTVEEDYELDALRGIHKNLSNKEVKDVSYAVHLEDKILAKQEAQTDYWG